MKSRIFVAPPDGNGPDDGTKRLAGSFRYRRKLTWLLDMLGLRCMPSRPREFHPEPLTDSGRDTLASSGSCHRTKAAAFR
jgi:hypothetical protein